MVELSPTLFGLFVGFLVGLTGVGGGSLMTPFLLASGVPAPTAIGTDLVFATITKSAGSLQHYRQRSVQLQVAIYLGVGSIPASLLGVATLEWLKSSHDPARLDAIMSSIIAATLVVVGASLIFRSFLPREVAGSAKTVGAGKEDKEEEGSYKEHAPSWGSWDGKSPMSRRRRRYTVLFGAMGGYLVGLTSIGSGSIMAIILLLVYPLSPAVVVGTDIAHATVLSLVTGVAHMSQGNVDFALAGSLLVGGIPGVLVGSRVAPWLPSRPLKLILALMLVFVGGSMII